MNLKRYRKSTKHKQSRKHTYFKKFWKSGQSEEFRKFEKYQINKEFSKSPTI